MPIAVKSGGVWRYPKTLSVNDNGSWRAAKRFQLNDGGAWNRNINYIGNFTIAFDGTFNTYGFDASAGQGSRSPTTEAAGFPVTALTFSVAGGSTDLTFVGTNGQFSGIAQTSYIKLVTVAGVTATTASCSAFFNLSNNSVLIWRWTTDLFALQANNGNNLSLQFTQA